MIPPMSPGHNLPPPSSTSNPFTSFPVLAIAISGILATAVLLLSYYVFVIKCCRYWRRRGRSHDIAPFRCPMNAEFRGLQPSLLRSLPVVRYSRPAYDGGGAEENVSSDSSECCAVCLIEFQEEERMKLLPGCFHAFHIDCIDAWLQSNVNCPLCRVMITGTTPALTDQILVPAPGAGECQRGEVVVEVRDGCRSWRSSPADGASGDINPSPKKKKRRKSDKVGSMGDECIDIRTAKDELFFVQPMRRSFSMDSSSDRQLYLSVQDILNDNQQHSLQLDKRRHRPSKYIVGRDAESGGGGGGRARRSCS